MRLLILLPLMLVACAPSRDACDRAVLREFRTVDRLVEETRTNLARGYTYESAYPRTRAGIVLCSGGSNVRFCTSNVSGPRRRPVAIDPEAERRKLAQLEARRDALATRGAALCQPQP